MLLFTFSQGRVGTPCLDHGYYSNYEAQKTREAREETEAGSRTQFPCRVDRDVSAAHLRHLADRPAVRDSHLVDAQYAADRRPPDRRQAVLQIGRASCRERV